MGEGNRITLTYDFETKTFTLAHQDMSYRAYGMLSVFKMCDLFKDFVRGHHDIKNFINVVWYHRRR